MAFVKLHDSILDSSLMEEAIHIRWVWVGMLSITDQDGIVRGTVNALARRLNVSVDEMEDALRVLMEPDPESTSEELDGRRLVQAAPNRWKVVNYDYYRRLASDEQRREKTRERTRRWRERQAGDAGVTHGDACDAIVEGEAEAEVEVESSRTRPPQRRARFTPPTVDEVRTHIAEKGYTFDAESFVAYYTANGWKVGRSSMKDWHAACVTWQKRESPKKAQQQVGATPKEHPYTADDVREYQAHARWDEYLEMCLALPRDRWPAPRFSEWLAG